MSEQLQYFEPRGPGRVCGIVGGGARRRHAGPSRRASRCRGRTAICRPKPSREMRTLRLKHHWTGESLDVVYRIGDAYQPEAMAEINHFLRDWRCNKTIEMDPKLIDRLYELQQRIGDAAARSG